MSKGENILVTGASGLVGSHLLYELTSSGNPVCALIRNKESIPRVKKIFSYYTTQVDSLISKIKWIEGNVQDYIFLLEVFEDIKYVYHTAACVSFNPFEKDLIFSTNIYGTQKVVNACLENKVEKLCYLSSIAALGNTYDDLPIDEKTIWMPSNEHSAYTISKFFSETEVWRGMEEGLKAVILNPSVILGPGDWTRGSSSILSAVDKGLKYYTCGGTGYVDVRDVTKAMILVMNSNIDHERFILNSENLSYKDLLFMFSKALKMNTRWRQAKPWILNTAWLLEYLKYFITRIPPKITKDIVRTSKNTSVYSNQKIKNTLSLDFIPVKESVRHMVECYKKQ